MSAIEKLKRELQAVLEDRMQCHLDSKAAKPGSAEAAQAASRNKELRGKEEELRKAIAEIKPASGGNLSPEHNALLAQCSVGRIVAKAISGDPLDGAEKELQSEVGINGRADDGGQVVPWALLAARSGNDVRAQDVASDQSSQAGPRVQRPVIQRCFARSASAFLSAVFEEIPQGTASFLAVSTGPAAAEKSAGADTTAASFTLQGRELSPGRIVSRAICRIEDVVRLASGTYERAITRDLLDGLSSGMDSAVLNDSTTGVFARLPDATAPTAVTTFGKFLSAIYDGVDGSVFARTEQDVKLLMGKSAYQVAGGIVPTGTATTAAEVLRRISGGVMATAHIAAPATISSQTNIERAVRYKTAGMGGPALTVCYWGGGPSIVRDAITRAGRGEIALTCTGLFAHDVTRADDFDEVLFKTA